MADEQDATRRRRRSILPSWALTVFIGVAVYWLLRDQVLDAYPVPTPSMEPTIEGDALQGDVVIVDKTFDNRARPGRFDTIVFEHEENRRIVVKRVVGLGGEWIRIRRFDLWVGDSADSLKLVRKNPVEHADLLATLWDSARVPKAWEGRHWRQERTRVLPGDPPPLEIDGRTTTVSDLFPRGRFRNRLVRGDARWREAWNLRWQGMVTTGYLDGFSRLQEGRAAFDFGLRARVRAAPRTTLWIELLYGRLSFALRYEGRGEASLWQNGEPRPEDTATRPAPPLEAARVRDLTFLYMDGAFHLTVDGRVIMTVDVPSEELGSSPVDRRGRAANGLALAVAGGKATLEHLAVVHDFHYLEVGAFATYEPYEVPENEYLVLGDNSQDSRDSRHYGNIKAEDLIGRPIAIAAPWNRRRWIRR